jgi:chemotaxis protein MotA
MDIGPFLGLFLSFGMVVLGILSSGSPILTFWDFPSFLIVVVGSYGALYTYGSIKGGLGVWGALSLVFKKPNYDQIGIIKKLMAMSEKARREGLLALEDQLEDIDDAFIKKGMRMVIDGTDAGVVEDLLSNDVSQSQSRHVGNQALINMWAGLAPGLGMLGTVIGLIGMLKNLQDKSALGPNMAVALITTLYGSIIANLFMIPMNGKLMTMDGDESSLKEMEIEGILSIQAGDNPRILAQKLLTYLDPKTRRKVESEIVKD